MPSTYSRSHRLRHLTGLLQQARRALRRPQLHRPRSDGRRTDTTREALFGIGEGDSGTLSAAASNILLLLALARAGALGVVAGRILAIRPCAGHHSQVLSRA